MTYFAVDYKEGGPDGGWEYDVWAGVWGELRMSGFSWLYG
jgi:hypothetical protein